VKGGFPTLFGQIRIVARITKTSTWLGQRIIS